MDAQARANVVEEWEKINTHLRSLTPKPPGAEWAAQNARIVVQGLEMFSNRATAAGMQIRDTSMAANVRWIIDQSQNAKVILWAHNFHLMTAQDPMGTEMMGMKLRRFYGHKLVVFGFVFHQGSFQAAGANWRLRDFTVGPAPEGSLDATLAATGLPLFALNLRTAPMNGPVREWLAAGHLTRSVMQMFLETAPESINFKHDVTQRYDALIFVA